MGRTWHLWWTVLLVQDMEGCSSHMGSKTIVWSEISPGGASGFSLLV